MLRAVGAASIDDLFVDVPEAARLRDKIEGLPDHLSEMAVERELARLSRRNLVAGEMPFFLGCGATVTISPPRSTISSSAASS
jgi:glycine dehydrogenase subunit 1